MPANWSNRTLWTGDNLDIMRGMNSESVDLIYLDPAVQLEPHLQRHRKLGGGRRSLHGYLGSERHGRGVAQRTR